MSEDNGILTIFDVGRRWAKLKNISSFEKLMHLSLPDYCEFIFVSSCSHVMSLSEAEYLVAQVDSTIENCTFIRKITRSRYNPERIGWYVFNVPPDDIIPILDKNYKLRCFT